MLPNVDFKESNEWFFRLFGFEEDPNTVTEKLFVESDGKYKRITSKVNNASYLAGNFQVRHLSSFATLPEIGGGTLNVLIGTGKLGPTDVMRIESDPENNGSTVQIASNFNCLDHIPDGCHKPPLGRCSDYITYLVQAPPAAVACGPALLYRQYFVPISDKVVGQLEVDLNLIESTPIHVEDGYTTSVPFFDDYKNPEHYPIGLHQNVAVTLGRAGQNFRMVENQFINQVFCSAIAFNHLNIPVTKETVDIASQILETEYLETVLAAWECSLLFPERAGSQKLFLTMLGGGVFLNPLECIGAAIEKCCDVIIKSGLEVYVVCFDEVRGAETVKLLSKAIDRTKGKVMQLGNSKK